MSTALVPVGDIEKMARAVAASRLFGLSTPEQAMALMLIAQAEGLHPAIAARDYHVIDGKPTLKADAMLARFQGAGGKVEWLKYTDTEVSAKFSHAQGGCVEIEWTIEQAKRVGLASKTSWKNYPRQMMRARVISEGIRTVFPGVAVGVYTPEEAGDFAPPKDVTPKPKAPKPEVIEGEVTTLSPPPNANGSSVLARKNEAAGLAAAREWVNAEALPALAAMKTKAEYDKWMGENNKRLNDLHEAFPEQFEALEARISRALDRVDPLVAG